MSSSRCLLCLLFLALNPYVLAQDIPKQIAAPPAKVSNSASSNSHSEAVLLREQNKLIRDYQGSLLDTVYWALGGIFATAIVLAGFGWLSSFKLYEADKSRLRDELTSKIKELHAQTALNLAQIRTALEHELASQLGTHLDKVRVELTEAKNQLFTDHSDLNNHVDELRTKLEAATQSIAQIHKGLAHTNAELRHVEEHIWDLKNIPGNVLITQTQGLEAAISAGNTHQIKTS